MVRSFISRSCAVFLVVGAIALPGSAIAQSVLPRAGQNFSFGIVQGPDQLFSDSAMEVTKLTLTVVSAYSGCGVISSPSGYKQDFTFIPGTATVIDLPYNLMLLNDLGKSNKGLLVHTTEPVNLVLHDYAPDAGDATQILPDDALDTSYVSFGWGIWDDPTDPTPERNNNEFLVTAASDSTIVTIIPSVNTLNGQQAGVASTVQLDRGECYIVKADTSDHPSDPSLSGSKIQSTKPVSVISGLTCGYVPLGAESCNELLDELIGKKWWGSHFLVQPLGNLDSGVYVVLTSDRDFFATVDNGFSNSTNGRLVASFPGTAEIRIFDAQKRPILAEAHQLTRGNDFGYIGDPTLVTVLDTAYYTDTLVWNTPKLTGAFENWVPIICPTADLGQATLDGTPLSSTGAQSSVIGNGEFSAINPSVQPGEHLIISPDPIFAIVAGFDAADAYSFVAGTAGSPIPRDTITHTIVLHADSAQTCSDVIVKTSFAVPVLASENLISLTIPITYDPSTLHLVGIQPGAILMAGNYTVDSSTPGFLAVTIYGDPFITGSDLFGMIFEGWKTVAATTVGNASAPTYCGDDSETMVIQPVTFRIAPSPDAFDRQFLVSNTTAAVCEPLTIVITTDSIVTQSDGFILSGIGVNFNTSTEHFMSATGGALLTNVFFTQSGQASGNYMLQVPAPDPLSGSDSLIVFQFDPQMVSAGDTIRIRIFYLRCGDTLSRELTVGFPVVRKNDTTHTVLTVSTSSVSLGDQALVDVGLSGLPATANIEQFDLYLTYNHDLLLYDHADLNGTLAATWPPPTFDTGRTTDTLQFTSLAPLPSAAGILAHLWFKTFVADSSYSPIAVTSSLVGTNSGCQIVFVSPQASTMFQGQDLCGDSVLRSGLLRQPIAIDRAQITAYGDLELALELLVPSNISLSLTDILGRVVWSEAINGAAGSNGSEFVLPQNIPNGPLMLRVSDGLTYRSRELLLVK